MQFRRGELEPLCKLTQARALLTVQAFKGTKHARLATTLTDGPSVLVLGRDAPEDRKSTRLNSSHGYISYAVFCLKKKKKKTQQTYITIKINRTNHRMKK